MPPTPTAGHIPTAKSSPTPWLWNLSLDASGTVVIYATYKDADTLREMASGVVGWPVWFKEIIVYCGVGGYASTTYFVLSEVLGYKNVGIKIRDEKKLLINDEYKERCMRLLEGERITKRFGGLIAVNNVDFDVDKGSIAGLIGPNGAGKTTLFNVISGTFPPTSGMIKFEGKNIKGLKPHRICKLGIARTFQTPKPFPNMTVFENVLAAALFGCTKDKGFFDVKQELNQILKKFGLAEKCAISACSLTAFEQRLLEVVRALSTKPKLLLLDEVMAGLNPTETRQMLEVVRELRDNNGITIFMIEHNMRAVMEAADRIMVLNHGVKIAEGAPEEVAKNADVIEAYLGEAYARG